MPFFGRFFYDLFLFCLMSYLKKLEGLSRFVGRYGIIAISITCATHCTSTFIGEVALVSFIFKNTSNLKDILIEYNVAPGAINSFNSTILVFF